MLYTSTMKLIVGLGNPEKKYDGTRHNIGFAVLDTLAEEKGAKWQLKEKFKAHIAELPERSALLVKPTTYYNLVGESVRAIADFYKITPESILIIHDDHALPFGILRTRAGGSDAGNNGIKSINAHIPGTHRLRIGTHAALREHMNDADYVLSKFSDDELQSLAALQENIFDLIVDFTNGDLPVTTLHL